VNDRYRPGARHAIALCALLVVSCSGDGEGPITEPPAGGSIAITVSTASVDVNQGGSGTVTVTLARNGGFSGGVSLAVQNAPPGVTATASPATIAAGATSATVSIQAGATAAAGTSTLTIRASASGVNDATATVSVVVASPPGPQPGGDVTWPVCVYETEPLWFAFQDGNGPWTPVTPTGSTYTFQPTADRVGVARVTASESGGYTLLILYNSHDELAAHVDVRCDPSLGTNAVNGTVAGMGASDLAWIALGGGFTSTAAGQNAFMLQGIGTGPLDLLAARVETVINGTTFASMVRQLILRRNLHPANGSTLPPLDFGSSEAFDPATPTVTVDNLSGDIAMVTAWYHTENGIVNTYYADGLGTAGATRTWYGVPATQQQATDLHALSVNALPPTQPAAHLRNVTSYFKDAVDRTVSLGPLLTMPTVSAAATTPYARLRMQLDVQQEYEDAWGLSYAQIPAGQDRVVAISLTRGYTGDVSSLDVAIPDFTGTAGWDAAWAPRSGVETQWSIAATGWTAPSGSPFSVMEGGISRTGTRSGAITP